MANIQDEDYKWFLENYNDLFDKYGEKYLSIKNKEILGVYNSFREAIDETDKTQEPGSYIVQFCNGKESAYTNYIASMFNIVA